MENQPQNTYGLMAAINWGVIQEMRATGNDVPALTSVSYPANPQAIYYTYEAAYEAMYKASRARLASMEISFPSREQRSQLMNMWPGRPMAPDYSAHFVPAPAGPSTAPQFQHTGAVISAQGPDGTLLDPELLHSQPQTPAPVFDNGNDEGHNNGDADRHSLIMEEQQQPLAGTSLPQATPSAGAPSLIPSPAPSPPSPPPHASKAPYPSPSLSASSTVPEVLRPNNEGNKVTKAKGKGKGKGKANGNDSGAGAKTSTREVCQEACTQCRRSKTKCTPGPDPNTCSKCSKNGIACNRGSTTDHRKRSTNKAALLRTAEACQKYLADLLVLVFVMYEAKPEKEAAMPTIRDLLLRGAPDPKVVAYILTDGALKNDCVARAQSHVRLDALAGLLLDLDSLSTVGNMRTRKSECVAKTREHVRTLGQYLHVLIDGEADFGDVKASLATVVDSRAPFGQIDAHVKAEFGFLEYGDGAIVQSLIGQFDSLVNGI